ncbi:WD40-repeat-containing domain protein [Entophlyctis helioformis]|nr:WD40-repeat-containing domain protein [Entophlyctis helioformis]
MVKLYLRYKQQPSFGVITSAATNVVLDTAGTLVYAPQLEAIGIIHAKQGIQLATLRDNALPASAHVTRIALSPNALHLAAGYSDGSIRIWNVKTYTIVATFHGHRAPISALTYDRIGARLASGSSDTDIVLWDIVAETGLFRLRGHKDQVTCLRFLSLNGLDHLVSGSKDTLVKFWDLATKHCVETLVTHRGEVWALDIHPLTETLLFTGAADGQIRVWAIDPSALSAKVDGLSENAAVATTGRDSTQSPALASATTMIGNLERQSKERILTLKMDPRGAFLAIQGADRLVEVFKMRSDAEVEKKLERRRRRLRRDGNDAAADQVSASVDDRLPKFTTIRCTAKVSSFSFAASAATAGSVAADASSSAQPSAPLRVVCSLANNSIEVYELVNSAEAASAADANTARLLTTVDMSGHRSDIRALALNSGDDLLVTGSSDLIKVWSTRTRQCLKTMESGYVLCCAFIPGDKQVVVGTKAGELQLFDLASSSLLESIQAHEGPIWSLQVRADKQGIITGSQDKEVRVWDLRLKQDDAFSKIAKRPTLVHVRTLKMSDDVLCVKQSPDGRLLAVALLDSTVKVFYYDTLKFFLSLYGHKLPVISMDISSDSSLIATASSDKSVKLWGLDFGDCHKSLHAHEDSVMACQFVWGTHFLFTASKDKTLKYWDADKFEQVQRLEGHHGEVWSLAVAKYGSFVVSGSHDRSLRLWEKTDDQFTLEEERERLLEEMHEREAAAADSKQDMPIGSGAPDAGENIGNGLHEVGAAGTKTADTLKAGEKIMEALEVWEKERGDFDKYDRLRARNVDVAPPPRSPFVIATGKPDMLPEEYVLFVVSQIRSSQLDEALLVLPFSQVIGLLKCVAFWIEKGWSTRLTSRILFFLLQTHHHEMTSTRALRPVLERIRRATHHELKEHRDRVGYNVAGIQFLQREYESRHSSFFGDDSTTADDAAADKSSGKSKGADGGKNKKRKRTIKVVS